MIGPATAATDLPLQHLRVTAVRPVAGPGPRQLQVTLAHWLVAVVQVPALPEPATFAPGAAWPPVEWPAGAVLLGYLDAQDATLF